MGHGRLEERYEHMEEQRELGREAMVKMPSAECVVDAVVVSNDLSAACFSRNPGKAWSGGLLKCRELERGSSHMHQTMRSLADRCGLEAKNAPISRS